MNSRISLWFVGVALLALVGSAVHADLQRVNVGVYGAQVRDIAAYAGKDAPELFIAAECNRGVFYWNTNSVLWETVTYPDLPGEATHLEVARHSGHETDMYVIITPPHGGGQLCGSATGGVLGSWVALTNSTIPNPAVIAGHTSGVYVGTWDGKIFRNTGAVDDPFVELYQHPSATAISAISPFDSGCIFAAVIPIVGETNVFKLEWTGAVFAKTDLTMPTATGSGLNPVRVHNIGVTPWDSNEVYIAGANSEVQVYHSTDGGQTWPDVWYNFNRSGNFYGGYPHYIKFDESRVFISHGTRDASGSWTSVQNVATEIFSGDTVNTHPNDAALAISPSDPEVIFFDTDWAVAAATCTVSAMWGLGTEIGTNKGIEGVILNDFAFHEYSASNKTLWIAAKSGIGRTLHFDPARLRTTGEPVDWLFPLYPDGAPAYSIAMNPTNPSVVLAGYNSGRVFRTADGEETNMTDIAWTQVFFGGDHTNVFGTPYNDVTISAVGFVPSRPDEAYLAGYRWQPPTTNGGVFFSADAGLTWTNDYEGAPVNCLMIMDNAVWAGVGSRESVETGIRAKVGLGTWWAPPTGTDLDDQVVTDMDGAIYGSRMIVYASSGLPGMTGGVYKGVNTNLSAGGFTNWVWTDVTAGIPLTPPVAFSAVTVDPTSPDRAFAASENCVFETTDGGATWTTLAGSCVDSHEDVRVLRYDDLVGGTGDGLFGYVLSGPQVEIAWSSETGKVYRLKSSTSITGEFSAISWDNMTVEPARRTARLPEPETLGAVFFRVEAEDATVPEIETIQFSE